jgi:hypothetical protein
MNVDWDCTVVAQIWCTCCSTAIMVTRRRLYIMFIRTAPVFCDYFPSVGLLLSNRPTYTMCGFLTTLGLETDTNWLAAKSFSPFGLTDVAACAFCPTAQDCRLLNFYDPGSSRLLCKSFCFDWHIEVRLDGWCAHPWNANSFLGVFVRHCEKRLRLCRVCPPVCRFVCLATWSSLLPLDRFEWNFIVRVSTKICRPNSGLVKIRKIRDTFMCKPAHMYVNVLSCTSTRNAAEWERSKEPLTMWT